MLFTLWVNSDSVIKRKNVQELHLRYQIKKNPSRLPDKTLPFSNTYINRVTCDYETKIEREKTTYTQYTERMKKRHRETWKNYFLYRSTRRLRKQCQINDMLVYVYLREHRNFIYPFIGLSIPQSIYRFILLSKYRSICMSVYVCMYMSM